VRTRGIGMRSEQSIDGLLREQPAGVAQVILQIGVVGTVRKGCKDCGGSGRVE